MESAVRWLRVSFIAGAVADALAGILMLIPNRMGETDFRYAMGMGAALMFGWTALLLWGFRKPMERKGILLLTILPVIAGLFATGIWAVSSGFFPLVKIIPTSVLQMTLATLMGFSYLKARNEDTRSKR